VAVDDSLLKHKALGSEDVFELNNGCLCCSVKQDLIAIITGLLRRKGRLFDAIIIETTGLADPVPVLQTFLLHPQVQ
jgi:G3E family GTPase